MQNNRCYSFLAEGARRVGEPQPDVREDLEVEERELGDTHLNPVGGDRGAY